MKNKKNNLGWVRCFVLEISGYRSGKTVKKRKCV